MGREGLHQEQRRGARLDPGESHTGGRSYSAQGMLIFGFDVSQVGSMVGRDDDGASVVEVEVPQPLEQRPNR